MISRVAPVRIAAFVLLVAPLSVALAQPTPSAASPSASSPSGPAPHPLPFVSPIFGDDMILQRGKANTLWGWSDPGDKVEVEIGGSKASGVSGPDRRGQVTIQPPHTGGPYTVMVAGRQTVELHNVMVGDVWLCGGQSNMGLPLRFTRNGEEEVKGANYPEIRFFTVATRVAYRHADQLEGKWSVVSPQTADRISAVAYYFARKVQQEIRIPIGLVLDDMGGTPAEAWTSAEALRPLKDFDVPLAELAKLTAAGAPEYGNFVMHWYDEYDVGQKGHWSAADFDDSSWKTVEIPGGFSELGVPDTAALAWFRKEIDLPDPLPAGRAMLHRTTERMDTAYINRK
jgi:sialate O-acetylesterase